MMSAIPHSLTLLVTTSVGRLVFTDSLIETLLKVKSPALPRHALPLRAVPCPAAPRRALPCPARPGHAEPCRALTCPDSLSSTMLSFDNLGSPVTNHMKRKRSPELPLSCMASKRRSVDALDIFGVNLSDPAFAIPDSLAYQEVDTKWLVDSR